MELIAQVAQMIAVAFIILFLVDAKRQRGEQSKKSALYALISATIALILGIVIKYIL